MIVKLPGQYSGEKIIAAFNEAATFQENPEKKWETEKFVKEYQYEPGSATQTVRSLGVRVQPCFLKKKWGLWGKKVWKLSYDLKFTLNPVTLSALYDEFDISVRYVYDCDDYFEYVATDPNNPAFEDIRPQLEMILQRFYGRLQAQTS
ncbi:MAG: hypothetical protein V1867_07820 [Candidatus Falkowbacteria bacterium]